MADKTLTIYKVETKCGYPINDDLDDCGKEVTWLIVNPREGTIDYVCDAHLALTLDLLADPDERLHLKTEAVKC